MPDPLATAVVRLRLADEAVAKARVAAKQLVEAAKVRREAARDDLAVQIAEAAREGRRQRDIVAVTGLSRERVRQICRSAGVEAD